MSACSDERSAVIALVQKCFELTTEQAEALIVDAENQRRQAVGYYEFTSLINKQCKLEEKIQLIESLWRIAYADGQLDPREEYLVRKLADLLYVPHSDFIKAKLLVSPNS